MLYGRLPVQRSAQARNAAGGRHAVRQAHAGAGGGGP